MRTFTIWSLVIAGFGLGACDSPYEIGSTGFAQQQETFVTLEPTSPDAATPDAHPTPALDPAPVIAPAPTITPAPAVTPGPAEPIAPVVVAPEAPATPLGPGIWIKISRIEISVEGGGRRMMTILREGQMVNLVEMQEDVLKYLEISLPVGKRVHAIRLVTAEAGHRVISSAGADLCPASVQVPSGSQSGLKLQLGGLAIEADQSYRLTMNLGHAPVVFQRKGSCLIHPSYGVN